MLSFIFPKKWIYDNIIYEEKKYQLERFFCDMVNDSVL